MGQMSLEAADYGARVTIDGTYVTDGERIRVMRAIEEQANVEANTTVVAGSLQRSPIASAEQTVREIELAQDAERPVT